MSTNSFSQTTLYRVKRSVAQTLRALAPLVRSPFRSGRMLIVRHDAIGDYILFRNFLETLSANPRWNKYKITLLGNSAFRDIAEKLDSKYVSEFIWVDNASLKDEKYFMSLVARLKQRGFDVAVNPVHSRAYVYDYLLHLSGSKKLIGSVGDIVGYDNENEKKVGDNYYDQLIPIPTYSQFEFYRNRVFFQALTGEKDQTVLKLPFETSPLIDQSGLNIVLFPGAGIPARQWPASSFATLIDKIANAAPGRCRFIIAGGPGDSPLAREIASLVSTALIDITGKTTLTELINVIGGSQLLISNETSAVHIAAGTGVPAVCVSNGNHFGRFNPYPQELADKIITVYPKDDFYSDKESVRRDLVEAYRIRSTIDIKLITVDRLVNVVKEKISNLGKRGIEVPAALDIFKKL